MTLEQLRSKVKQLFPGFKSQGILRFSSLLGPGKPSSQPRIWREAQKPKRKRNVKKSVCSWRLDLDYVLPPESISDDTVSLCVCVCVGGGGGGG